jgi:anti-anti-sigma factor
MFSTAQQEGVVLTRTRPTGNGAGSNGTVHTKTHQTIVAPPLEISVQRDGHTTLLRLAGELDMATADELRRHILMALEHHDPHRLLLDLSKLDFTDSSGLAALVWAHQLLSSRGRQLRLHHPQPQVRRVLHITGLHTRLHITESPHAPRRSDRGARQQSNRRR